MKQRVPRVFSLRRQLLAMVLVFGITLGSATYSAAQETKKPAPEKVERPGKPLTGVIDKAFEKSVPTSLSDLLAIQKTVSKVVPHLQRTTVGVRVGRAQGSGVIISKDGYVLTAAHVSGGANRTVTIILHDGRQVKGKTLGVNRGIDAGLMKITSDPPKGGWEFAPMGEQKKLKMGDWAIGIGHPRGYQRGRAPVVRLGRLMRVSERVIQSGCVLVGGDSGGPLFDVRGNVVGIHSRIGPTTVWNFHVPISAYTNDWGRLAKGEEWGRGRTPARANPAVIGVSGENHAKGCKVTTVNPALPAAKAGIKPGDIITRFDGRPVRGFESLYGLVGRKKAGDKVKVVYLRDDKEHTVDVVLAKRP